MRHLHSLPSSVYRCMCFAIVPVSVAIFLHPVSALGLLRFVGLQGMTITYLWAAQSDAGDSWFPGTSNLIFAATEENGIYQGVTWDGGKGWTSIGPFSASPPDIVAMTVQHWGVGPRDGLNLLASIRAPRDAPGTAVLLRKEVALVGDPTGTEWLRADSGITHADTSSVVYALTSFYYTGHTPPQPVLGWTGSRSLRGNAAGIFWEEGEARGWLAVSMDVTPKWFGTNAWAAGTVGQGFGDAAVFRSTDQGVSWTVRTLGLPIPGIATSVAVCPGHPDTIFVILGSSVLRSTTGMNSWMGLPVAVGEVPIGSIFDPLYPTHVYVATRPGFAVYKTENLGDTWHRLPVPTGVDPAEITCMTMAMLDTVPMGRPPRRGLFLGTAGTGVWMYDIDMTPVEVNNPAVPAEKNLAVYPNPAKDAINLQVSLPSRKDVRIECYDVLGRVLIRKSFGTLNSGTHHLGMSTLHLIPGVYTIRIVGDQAFAPAQLRILR